MDFHLADATAKDERKPDTKTTITTKFQKKMSNGPRRILPDDID